MTARALADRIERAQVLDRPGNIVQRAVRALLRGRVRDALHGVWLGHPVHPAIVSIPLGAWLSAAILDSMKVEGRAPSILIGVGSAGAVPAAVTGLNDWSALTREQRRVGLVHAVSNSVALGLHLASLAARRRGDFGTARRLSLGGLAAVTIGGYFGGHLAYRQAASVNQAAPQLRHIPEGWHAVCDLRALTPGKPQVHHIEDVPVLVVRTGDGDVTVMLERCAHNTGPLGDGDIIALDGSDCIVCPWHGSTFRLTDGTAVHGPAATSQPLLRTRIHNGQVEVALP